MIPKKCSKLCFLAPTEDDKKFKASYLRVVRVFDMLGLLLDTEEYRNGFASGLGRQIPIFSLVKKPAHS